MNRCMWKRFIYIQQKLWLVKDYRKEYRRLTWLTRKTKSDINQFNQLILISTNISQKKKKEKPAEWRKSNKMRNLTRKIYSIEESELARQSRLKKNIKLSNHAD